METALLILAALLLIAGALGSFLPVLPGPPLAWMGLCVARFFTSMDYSASFFLAATVLMLIITALDYFLPALLVRWGRGSRYASNGANIGMLLGLFLPPLGIILGPLIGAFAGEIAYGTPASRAVRPAILAFFGFLSGILIKLVYAGWLLVDFFIRIF